MAEMDLDGWRVRIAGGYSDRANSITPFALGQREIHEKVIWCEQFYEARHLPVIFRITDLQPDRNIDSWLKDCGYKMSWTMETAVCDLATQTPTSPAHVRRTDRAGSDWIAAALAIDRQIEPYRVPFSHILGHMPAPKCFARIDVEGIAVSVGAATVAGDLMGVFLMRTRLDHRRRGHGRSVLSSLLAWGKSQGATTAWLQFGEGAEAAAGLYRATGFIPLYNYHYRRKA